MASRFSYVIVLLSVVWVSAPAPATAETVKFTTMNFAPYALAEDDSGRRGLFVDINATIAAKAGIDIVDSVVPIARVMKNLQRGVSDCAVFLLSPWSGANFLAVAEVVDRFDSVIVTRKDLSIARVEDLHGQLLALPRGSYKEFPIATDPNIRRYPTNGYEQSAKLLKAGRVDAIAGTALSIYHNLSILSMSRKDVGVILPFDSKPVWLQCAKQQLSDGLIARLQQATDSLRAEGVFRRLVNQYVPPGFR
ncbi:MAG: transporter substrate-binding domain-containing protein [Alphaproteobacteria bacterium]|nr:transporter substrate-binding domain-containing protein [Alphaproteobacteria bacterium]